MKKHNAHGIRSLSSYRKDILYWADFDFFQHVLPMTQQTHKRNTSRAELTVVSVWVWVGYLALFKGDIQDQQQNNIVLANKQHTTQL